MLKASVVRLYGIVVVLGRWVRMGCARLLCGHGVLSLGPGPGEWLLLRGHLLIRHSHPSLFTIVLLLFNYCLYVIILLSNIHEEKEATKPAVVYIGDRLREVRARRLLTQEELSEKSGVSPSTVANIERDHREPHFRTIRKLAKALDVDPSELTRK
jgi:DNA-binding XRE family transcriptional regulator